MGPANCAVVGCYNSTKKLKKWRESNCEIHGVLRKDCICVLQPTLSTFWIFKCFKKWRGKRKVDRAVKMRKQAKLHGNPVIATGCVVIILLMVAHPFPELKLGYEKQIPQPRRKIFKDPIPPKKLRNILLQKPFKHLHLEPQHAKTKSNILNFHWNTSTACCQVMKSVAVAFIRTY